MATLTDVGRARRRYERGPVRGVEGSDVGCVAANWVGCYYYSCSHWSPPVSTHADVDDDDDGGGGGCHGDGGDEHGGKTARCSTMRPSADLAEALGVLRNNFRSSSRIPVTSHGGHVLQPSKT